MKSRYWLIVVLVIVLGISVFFNIKIMLANGTETGKITDVEIQQIIQEKYGAEFFRVLEELKPLKMEECISDFVAKLTVGAFFEKPFSIESADRIGTVKEIVADLTSKGVADLPEEHKVELFLSILVRRVFGSEFLTVEEYVSEYEGSCANRENIVELDPDKFPGAFYLKFNKIRGNTFSALCDALAGIVLCDNSDLFSGKYVLDFRGSKGPVEVGARSAELFFSVNYDKENIKRGLYDTTFKIPPQFILFNRIHRSLDPRYWDYWKDVYCYTVNPLFEKMLDDNIKLAVDKRFDPYTITVKNSRIPDFDNLISKFNETVNKMKIIILVDSETSGAGELVAALLKTYKKDVVIIGEPTVGNILMQTIYNIECVREDKEKTEPPLGKPVFTPFIIGDLRGKTKESIGLGVLILTDSYWYNPDMDKNCKLKNIHQGGITPDYIAYKEDGEDGIMYLVRSLLDK